MLVRCCLPLILTLLLPRPGIAQERDASDRDASSPARLTSAAAEEGAYLPMTAVPDAGAARGRLTVTGGYDDGRGAPVLQAATQLHVWGPLTFVTEAQYAPGQGDVQPRFGLGVRLTPVGAPTVVAVAGAYDASGYEGVPEVDLALSVGRRWDGGGVFATVAVGRELDEAQQHGQADLAVLQRVSRRVLVGLDSRLELDLDGGRDDEAIDDVDYAISFGPTACVTAGRVALFVWAGPSGVKLESSAARWGVSGGAGFGTAF